MNEVLIPYVTPDLVLNKNIALVGSSGQLKEQHYGEVIDSFDEVARFNRAPTSGYEAMVGEKTTIRVVNNHVFNNNDISHEGYTDQPKDFVKNMRDSKILYFAEDLAPYWSRNSNTHESNEVYLFQYSAMEFLKKTFSFGSNKNLTLGLGFICTLIISDIKPTLFGFDIEDRPRDHYWEDRPLPSEYHGISAEKQLLNLLKDNNLLTII